MAMLLEVDYQMVLYQRAMRRERVFRDRLHPLDRWTDTQMYTKYRFSRLGCIYIIDRLKDDLQHPTRRNHALPPSLQVFIALRFYGHGSLLDDSAAEPHGVSIPTACRAVKRVTRVLIRLQHEFIKFPRTPQDVRQRQEDFFAVRGFPRVVGAIDCTHVRLHGVVLGEDEYVYINRKGKYSLNVQLICDARYRILNVVARWPGSTHDTRVLRESRIWPAFENQRLHGLLLGDSGYPLREWLMTPIQNPGTEAEEEYNRVHAKTRVLIEHLNGQLKSKFRCLGGDGGPKVRSPELACDVIVACATLFNISKDVDYIQDPWNVEDFQPDPEDIDGHDPLPPNDGNQDIRGAAVRNELVDNFFTRQDPNQNEV